MWEVVSGASQALNELMNAVIRDECGERRAGDECGKELGKKYADEYDRLRTEYGVRARKGEQ